MLDPQIHGSAIKRFGEWAVTTNGLAKADGSFHIPVAHLWDLWADGANDKWGWPILAVKRGVLHADDRADFNEAFFHALEQFKAFRPPLPMNAKPSSHATLALQERWLSNDGRTP
jgi:hypothetical protein